MLAPSYGRPSPVQTTLAELGEAVHWSQYNSASAPERL